MNVSREHSRQLETRTMLIIDAHPAGLDVISGPLQARGLEVALAQDGADGLKRARALQPDLVLLGAVLPDMKGLEICRQLKASEGTRDAPVIFMLAADEEQYVNQYLEAGAADYVNKPLQAAPALARISAHLRLRALEQQAAAQTQAEHSLRQQAYLLENVSDAIIFTDPDFVIQGWNQAAAEIYGWRADEVMGKSFSEVARPEYPFVPREQVLDQFSATGHWKGEVVHHHKNGTPIHILGSVKLLKDEQGRPFGVVSANRDVTERVQAEQALRESEANLRAVAENAFDGILVYMGGQHVFANRRIAEMLGYSVAELLGTTLKDIVHPDEYDKVSGRFQRRQAGRAEPNQYETVYVSKSGQSVPVEITATTTTWQGQAAGLVVIRDISERLRAEEALRESEAQLRAILNATPFPIALVDLQDNNIDFWSRSALTLFGHTAPTAPEWYLIAYPEPDYRREVIERWKPALEKAQRSAQAVNTGEYRVTCRNGSVRICELYATFLADRLVVTFNDITERKQAEEKLQEYSERLEEMVEERTRELCEAQEQLVQRERLAVLGQLAGGVAHELRNPLGAIKNAAYFLNMVLDEPAGGVRDALGILNKEVGTSERIISSLLDYARVKSPMRRAVDLNRLVQSALSRVVVPESVTVTLQLDEALPTILADSDQLSQVFGNLILNAVQAMPEGGQMVLQSRISSPGWVCVSVSDTGVGVPPENLDRLFEPLFTTKARGIGLGLAIVKSLVEGHGGQVEVQSQVEKGSTFTIVLPIQPEDVRLL